MARDRKNNEVVAMKRINTKQEENGFPITALREVKILKELGHANIVNLKEIVTSKGAYNFSSMCLNRPIVRVCLGTLADSQFHALLQLQRVMT